MSTPRDPAITTEFDHAHDAASSWPLLSEREMNRLRFLAYCRSHSRFRTPAPVRAEVDALCDVIIAALAAEPTSQVPPVPESLSYPRAGSTPTDADIPAWRAALASVPPTFAARRDCHPHG
ncbi:MAG TPA: hypothetical protein VF510_26380 [Ktedonobacterales bacterium]